MKHNRYLDYCFNWDIYSNFITNRKKINKKGLLEKFNVSVIELDLFNGERERNISGALLWPKRNIATPLTCSGLNYWVLINFC